MTATQADSSQQENHSAGRSTSVPSLNRVASRAIDAAIPELRSALGWLLDHDELELAGRLVAGLLEYGFLRLRSDVLAWYERLAEADPDDRSPWASRLWVMGAYAVWMAGDVAESAVRSARALLIAEQSDREIPAEVLLVSGNAELFQGHLAEAAAWYRRAAEAAAATDPAQWLLALGAEVLALGYAADPAAVELRKPSWHRSPTSRPVRRLRMVLRW
jgi:hypothetical protein